MGMAEEMGPNKVRIYPRRTCKTGRRSHSGIMDLCQFITAVIKDWLVRISGGLAFLLAFVWPWAAKAFNHSEWSTNVPLWLVIYVLLAAIFISCFKAWRSEHLEVVRYHELVRPKLKCSFRAHDAGCVRDGVRFSRIQNFGLAASTAGPTSTSSFYSWGTSTESSIPLGLMPDIQRRENSITATYYRIRVETDGTAQVPKCHGRLLEIKRGDEIIFDGEPADLPFAPSESADAIEKTIHDKAPEYLDFIAITSENKVFITTHEHKGSSSIDWENLFPVAGEYQFRIAIASMSPTIIIEPILKWTGDRQTSEMVCPVANVHQYM